MDRVLVDMGFHAVNQDGEHAEYKLKSIGKRLLCQFDDKIVVWKEGRFINVSGSKKYVGRIETLFMHYRQEYEPSI